MPNSRIRETAGTSLIKRREPTARAPPPPVTAEETRREEAEREVKELGKCGERRKE